MKLIPLPAETTRVTGFTHKISITYADLTTANAVHTDAIFPQDGSTFPAGTAFLACATNLVTAFDFSDAGITSLTLEIGDGTDPDRILVSQEIASDATEVLFKVSAASTQPYAYVAADTLDATFTAANGGSPLCSEATSGEIEIYLKIVDLNRLEDVD